jgi:hypothetical protein
MLNQPDLHHRLYEVIYRSKSTTDDNGRNDILEKAIERNSFYGITGILINNDDWFIQVLEGPCVEVTNMINMIETDTRHCDMIVLRSRFIKDRSFSNWTMHSLELNDDDFKNVTLNYTDSLTITHEFVDSLMKRSHKIS